MGSRELLERKCEHEMPKKVELIVHEEAKDVAVQGSRTITIRTRRGPDGGGSVWKVDVGDGAFVEPYTENPFYPGLCGPRDCHGVYTHVRWSYPQLVRMTPAQRVKAIGIFVARQAQLPPGSVVEILPGDSYLEAVNK